MLSDRSKERQSKESTGVDRKMLRISSKNFCPLKTTGGTESSPRQYMRMFNGPESAGEA